MRLLAKDPSGRPPSARAVAESIREIEGQLLAERQGAAPSPATPSPTIADPRFEHFSAPLGLRAPRVEALRRRLRRSGGDRLSGPRSPGSRPGRDVDCNRRGHRDAATIEAEPSRAAEGSSPRPSPGGDPPAPRRSRGLRPGRPRPSPTSGRSMAKGPGPPSPVPAQDQVTARPRSRPRSIPRRRPQRPRETSRPRSAAAGREVGHPPGAGGRAGHRRAARRVAGSSTPTAIAGSGWTC